MRLFASAVITRAMHYQTAAPVLAFLLIFAVFTPPAPLSLRGLLQLYASEPTSTSYVCKTEDTGPAMANNGSAVLQSPISHSSSVTNRTMTSSVTNGTLVSGAMDYNHTKVRDDTHPAAAPSSSFSALKATPARRQLLILVATGVGATLALTVVTIGLFAFGTLGVIGFILSCVAFALVMCVFSCALFSFFVGFGVSVLVGMWIAAIFVAYQLCINSIQTAQTIAHCVAGG